MTGAGRVLNREHVTLPFFMASGPAELRGTAGASSGALRRAVEYPATNASLRFSRHQRGSSGSHISVIFSDYGSPPCHSGVLNPLWQCDRPRGPRGKVSLADRPERRVP